MKFIKLTIAAVLCTSVYTYAQRLPSASRIQNIGLSRYVITDLGTISGKGYSSASGINNKGHVIGEADAGAPDQARPGRGAATRRFGDAHSQKPDSRSSCAANAQPDGRDQHRSSPDGGGSHRVRSPDGQGRDAADDPRLLARDW